MIIPAVPISQIVNADGTVSVHWRVFFDQLIDQLQSVFPESGYISPFKSNVELSELQSESLEGRQVFSEEQKNMQVNTTGIYKPVVTYEELTTAQMNAIPSGQRNGRVVYDTDLAMLFMGANDSFIGI